jgi:hypothetical protein
MSNVSSPTALAPRGAGRGEWKDGDEESDMKGLKEEERGKRKEGKGKREGGHGVDAGTASRP